MLFYSFWTHSFTNVRLALFIFKLTFIPLYYTLLLLQSNAYIIILQCTKTLLLDSTASFYYISLLNCSNILSCYFTRLLHSYYSFQCFAWIHCRLKFLFCIILLQYSTEHSTTSVYYYTTTQMQCISLLIKYTTTTRLLKCNTSVYY